MEDAFGILKRRVELEMLIKKNYMIVYFVLLIFF